METDEKIIEARVKLIDTQVKFLEEEGKLRKEQSSYGFFVIWGTICICLVLCFAIPIEITGKFKLSFAEYLLMIKHLFLCVCSLLVIGLTAGIILLKSSLKGFAKSYFGSEEEKPKREKRE